MAKVELRYVNSYTDRHGKPRHYFRRKGQPQVALPGDPGSEAFMAAYAAAMHGKAETQQPKPRHTPGSFGALLTAYYASTDFLGLAASTQAARRNILEAIRTKHGEHPVKGLNATAVEKLMAAKAHAPEAANHLRKVLRALMPFAVRHNYIAKNPMIGVVPMRVKKTGGHRTWTEEEITAFEARWAPETRERLAFALFLYTAARISDVATLGRQHLRGGKLHILPMKTTSTSGARVAIPVHPELRRVLDAHPKDQLTFVQTQHGQPYTAAGMGNWFREVRREAGLPEKLSAHGLRKAVGRRLAEAGCSANEIMSVLTHTTLEEAERYTREASRDRMAQAAFERIGGAPRDTP